MKMNKGIMILGALSILIFIMVPLTGIQASDKININTASAQELTDLKYIGDKIAERIVQYRQEHGPFKTLDEFTQVKGIGGKTFEANKDRITIN